MRTAILATGLVSALLLAACGETRTQRVLTGAAGGAVAGEVIDDRPVEGAVAGGLIGAIR
jgi:osmotically inducible lipoprotein OsmB